VRPQRRRSAARIHWAAAGYALVAGVLLAGIGFGTLFGLKQRALKKELILQQTLLETRQPIHTDMEQLRGVRRQLATQRGIIAQVRAQQVQLAAPLSHLSSILSPTISLVAIKSDTRQFSLTGYAQDNASLQSFFIQLRKLNHFTHHKIGVVKKSEQAEDTRIYFEFISQLATP